MTATTRNGGSMKSDLAAARDAAQGLKESVKETAQDVAETVKDRVDEAGSTLRKTAGAAKDAVKAVGEDVGARVTETAAHLRDQAGTHAAEMRDALTDTGDRLAETLRRAAASERTGEVPARVLNTAADGVAYAADGLRGTTLSDITAGIRGAAQRNPGLFAAGAALAGFALARFLMSSRSDRE